MSVNGLRTPYVTFIYDVPANVELQPHRSRLLPRGCVADLNFRGESRDDLALAIPAVAHWRLAKLPRCLSSEEVNRLIAAVMVQIPDVFVTVRLCSYWCG